MIAFSLVLLGLIAYYYTTRNYVTMERAVDYYETQKRIHLLNQPFVVIGIVHSANFDFVTNLYKQFDNIKRDDWFFYVRNHDLVPISLQLRNDYSPQNYTTTIHDETMHLHLYSLDTIHILNTQTRNYLHTLFDFTNYPNRDHLKYHHIDDAPVTLFGHMVSGANTLRIYHHTTTPHKHLGRFFVLLHDAFLFELPEQFLYDQQKYTVFDTPMTFVRHYDDTNRTVIYH